MINWEQIIISSLISVTISGVTSYVIAYYFRKKVKPKIEKIYEENREYRITEIAIILQSSHDRMGMIFAFLERNNLVKNEFHKFNMVKQSFNTSDVFYLDEFAKFAYDLQQDCIDIYNKINDAKQYIVGQELHYFLEYVHLSQLFVDELTSGNFNPEWLQKRAISAKYILERYSDYFSKDFVDDWDNILSMRMRWW